MTKRWMSRLHTSRGWRAIPVAVVLTVVLAACGTGDSGDEPASIEDQSAVGEATSTADAAANADTTATEESPTATSTEVAASGEAATGEEPQVAQVGDTVSVHYRGTLDDGSEFDSSAGRDPLQFTVGAGQVIPGFDTAVVGMTVGDKKEVRLEPDDAYGERNDERVISVPKEQAPEGLEVGQQVLLGEAPATVVDINDDGVTVDANHPLAGQALTFEIELVGVE